MKRDRSVTVDAAPTNARNNTQAHGGYDAYFVTYSVDDSGGTVTQVLLASLSSGNVGMTLTRAMRVTGNILIIELATTAADGMPVVRTLTWHRLELH